MASLRNCARLIREEAADGIAWIAIWKVGRSWNAEAIYPNDFTLETGDMVLESDDLALVREVMAADTNAIFVNGYYYNIACFEEGELPNVQDLANAIRWQYEDCHPLIRDWNILSAVN